MKTHNNTFTNLISQTDDTRTAPYVFMPLFSDTYKEHPHRYYSSSHTRLRSDPNLPPTTYSLYFHVCICNAGDPKPQTWIPQHRPTENHTNQSAKQERAHTVAKALLELDRRIDLWKTMIQGKPNRRALYGCCVKWDLGLNECQNLISWDVPCCVTTSWLQDAWQSPAKAFGSRESSLPVFAHALTDGMQTETVLHGKTRDIQFHHKLSVTRPRPLNPLCRLFCLSL
eukprot:scaffold11525_cov135-Cylindrotheca_fusiformis.AAC.8